MWYLNWAFLEFCNSPLKPRRLVQFHSLNDPAALGMGFRADEVRSQVIQYTSFRWNSRLVIQIRRPVKEDPHGSEIRLSRPELSGFFCYS